ncbi:hypothetical protein CFBP5473_19005 [Agrobacterium larrymoorei]|uniref:Uncharacterized protein n=1 Tax=Agrobacterium larrymoorei TaxID=160699 RepID=A0A4D7DYT9_9HYPH|nr:hypothetical protein CFBP5473_19005 [Agrobacterium larrymoorei]
MSHRAFLILPELRPKRRLKPSNVSGPPLSPRYGRGRRKPQSCGFPSPKRGEAERELDHGFQSSNRRRHR